MPTKRTASAAKKRKAKLVFALQVACNAARVPARHRLRAWAQASLKRSARLTVRVVDAREGRSLNRRFRGRDYATNVLTFIYDNDRYLNGDIALCAPVIAREAREQDKALDAHYAHLVVHGVLHLQGFDHEDAEEAETMEAREVRILSKLGYDNPYEDRPDEGRV